tara:strand:+ start:292 stop:954 length:663 start_codon:yes stop_codon:yes gene_type:complete
MAYRDTRVVIGKDKQLKPLLCALDTCTEPVTGNQEKYCSKKCCETANYKHQNKLNKGVHKTLSGKYSPRRMVSESSIKHDETWVVGDGRFVVEDHYVDPDIYAIAEANHEKYILDRNEYEARVVIDGLQIFKEEYNKHHDIKYEKIASDKVRAKYTEDHKIYIKNRNRKYWRKNKKKILAKQRARYRANPDKYNKIRKKYYYYTKQPELFKFEKWLRKRS